MTYKDVSMMRKPFFSLGLIIASNVLIIGIGLIYGLHIIPIPQNSKSISLAAPADEYRDLTIKPQG